MNVDNSGNNKQEPTIKNNKGDSTVKGNKQGYTVNNSKQDPIKSHVESLIEEILNNPSTNAQTAVLFVSWISFSAMTNISEKLSLIRGELGLAAIQAGFNSADETAKAGLFQLGGGVVFAGAGVAQGVAGCKKATELTQATEIRNSRVAEIEKNTMKEDLSAEGSDITIQVEAVDEPVTAGLDEIEEEIFYDAEETLSSKQTNPEEQAEEAQVVEKATVQDKMTEKEAKELIEKENREYDIARGLIEAKSSKIQGLAAPGQSLYYASQGLGDQEKAKAQKENLQKEVVQDNQNQIGNTADDLKRKADKIAEFDPFRSNSSSLKG